MRRIYVILVGLLITLVLAGCNGRQQEVPGDQEQKIVLSVLAGQSTSDAGIEDMLEEVIKREFPQVELEWECVDWGERFDSQIRGRFAAGDVPDIMIGKAQDAVSYAATGNLAPISEVCSSRIKEEALEAVTVNGEVYGLPYNAWYQGVIYNKQIFARLGLEVPETQEELVHIIEVLEEHDVTPFAGHFQESWKIGNMTMQLLMNEVFRESAHWGDQFRKGEVSFSGTESVLGCMQSIKEIKDASWEDVMSLNQFDSDSRFTNGDAAMYLTGSWSIQFANEYSEDIQLGIFPYPAQSGEAALIRETNITFMKSAVSEHSELITDILYTLISDQPLAEEILDFTQSFSVIKDIEPSHEIMIQEDINQYEEEKKVVDVSVGNSQLVWSFQNELAVQQMLWLQGEIELEEVLNYADENRMSSIYE